MKVLLVVTSFWRGMDVGPTFIEMPSMAECEKQAAEIRRRNGGIGTAVCLEQPEEARRRFLG
jgi:hypothetical protein